MSTEKYIQDVQTWATNTERLIEATGSAMGVTHRSYSASPAASLPKVRNKLGLANGQPARVAFTFPRQLVYPMTGAGKGQGGAKGSRWVDKYGIRKQTNPKSLNKANSGNRQAKPFINNALNRPEGITQLADIVSNNTGDILVAKLFNNNGK